MDLKPHNLSQELDHSYSYGDAVTRKLHKLIPHLFQTGFRDYGLFRSIADASVITAAAGMPHFANRFLNLGSMQKSFQYGETSRHMVHVIDLAGLEGTNTSSNQGTGTTGGTTGTTGIIASGTGDRDRGAHDKDPEDTEANNNNNNDKNVLVFVHGGAWGSGKPWMYRLSAAGIGKHIKASKIILVQYPVYPCANISQQKDAVCDALRYIRGQGWAHINPEKINRKIFLCGHSSGANICALALLESAEKGIVLADAFISLSGVFDIEKHYYWEMDRGVHLISPMGGAAIQPSRFSESSPTVILQNMCLSPITPQRSRLTQQSHQSQSSQSSHSSNLNLLSNLFPRTLVLHGTEDTTVPISSSIDFANELLRHNVNVKTAFPIGGHIHPILDMIHYEVSSPCGDSLYAWFRSLSVEFNSLTVDTVDKDIDTTKNGQNLKSRL